MPREPLAVSMSGVRMGERLLQLGVATPAFLGSLATKVGLTGHAVVIVEDDAAAERARSGAADAGGLIELHVTPFDALPFPDASFDVVIADDTDGALAALVEPRRSGALRESHRVLRNGGRILYVRPGTRRGIASWFARGRTPAGEGAGASAVTILGSVGFKPVRILADREGLEFIEGLRA